MSMGEEINYGVILGQRPEDWVAGAIGALPYEVRLPSGQWKPHLPTAEKQRNLLETMACVSFSACNCIETQEKHQTGKEVNYSDRWIAKMSGTTQNGNYLYKVGDTIRNYGMVLESDYPSTTNMTWDQYYADIPPAKLEELKAKGKKWLEKWDVKTEFIEGAGLGIWHTIKEDLIKHLKHAPLQVVIPGHAVMNFYCEADVNYFDTYKPFEKKTPYTNIQTAYKYVLTPKGNLDTMKLIKEAGTVYLQAGVNEKVKLGIADEATLALFGDEPVIDGTAEGTEYTISNGFIIHKK